MSEIYLKAMIITAVLLLFAIPGFALKKLGLLGSDAKKPLSAILLYVCQPALILSAFTVFSDADYALIRKTPRGVLAANFGITASVSLVALLLVLGVCRLLFLRQQNRSAADVYTYIAVFSNCGFLGVPFIDMFTDGNAIAVMYIMVFNIVFAVLIWTVGVYLIAHDRRQISVKKVLLNPTIIASAVALLMFFVPELNIFMLDGCRELQTLPQALATMTAPLAMILVGIALAELTPKQIFAARGVYVAGALRLIVAPLITFAVALLFYNTAYGYTAGLNVNTDYIFLAPVIAMAMSPASLIVAMAERYDGEKTLAASAYVNNTLLSVVTVPLIVTAVVEIWKFV